MGLFLRLLFKVIIFTRAWISFLLLYVIEELIVGKLLGITMNSADYPEIYPIYEIVLIVIMAIPIVFSVIQRIYSFVVHVKREFKALGYKDIR